MLLSAEPSPHPKESVSLCTAQEGVKWDNTSLFLTTEDLAVAVRGNLKNYSSTGWALIPELSLKRMRFEDHQF